MEERSSGGINDENTNTTHTRKTPERKKRKRHPHSNVTEPQGRSADASPPPLLSLSLSTGNPLLLLLLVGFGAYPYIRGTWSTSLDRLQQQMRYGPVNGLVQHARPPARLCACVSNEERILHIRRSEKERPLTTQNRKNETKEFFLSLAFLSTTG